MDRYSGDSLYWSNPTYSFLYVCLYCASSNRFKPVSFNKNTKVSSTNSMISKEVRLVDEKKFGFEAHLTWKAKGTNKNHNATQSFYMKLCQWDRGRKQNTTLGWAAHTLFVHSKYCKMALCPNKSCIRYIQVGNRMFKLYAKWVHQAHHVLIALINYVHVLISKSKYAIPTILNLALNVMP